MEQRLTPRQLALATGVSESSIKRWCDSGDIATVKTPGGHRRIPLSGAMQFLRRTEHPLERPELLGLPAATRRGQLRIDLAAGQLADALERGEEEICRQILFELYLNRYRVSEIGDLVIAPAFSRIGHRWETGNVEVFQERRAFEITRNLLHELRLSQQPPVAGAPMALGGTIAGDNYALAPILVELVLREVGWRACFLGSNLPTETLVAAIVDKGPKLFWLSVSHTQDDDAFVADFDRLRQAAGSQTSLLIGGRALTPNLRERLRAATCCEDLKQLERYSSGLLHGLAGLPGEAGS